MKQRRSRRLQACVVILGAGALAVQMGCAGWAFASQRIPQAFIYADASTNESVTQNKLGIKHGEACAESILGWVTTGDASVATAAKEGGITTIASVDHHASNVLGIFAKYCVIVTGE